ncbi:hypothetical protein F1188_08290 [Roseospira marina]|uniref:DUF1795 domain-containing protein n=1 Tax=Roseospira marina TaxID=140057 RepID=A0A5M6ICP9_9PROT|nr:hypothetical protein [Roseospira marina]KAA5606006.1 hypothetical protein F1188_08290 [Roseospira marina]MBB4313140.1 hypothetical protein [Roseospira marina]MBB5086119.1 hypothetical protein [Roseospira marina]
MGLLLASVAIPAQAAVDPRPPGPKPPPPGTLSPLRPIEGTTLATFAPDGWGYRLELPADWLVQTPAPYTVVVSGPAGTEAYFAPIAVQNVKAAVPGDSVASASQALADHVAGMRTRYAGLTVAREEPFRPPAGAADGDRDTLPTGRQVVLDWSGESGPMRQWVVARPRPRAAVVHLWTYTADRALFDALLPEARAVLDGWSLIGE